MADGTRGKTAPSVQSDPRTKGERTRERILELAYDAVIRKGFASTSIEELVEAAGITKSGFFYHFKDKTDLAYQLIERYTGENARFLNWLEEIARVYPPRGKASLDDLADAILAFTYGGMTLARALNDNSAISRQTMMFRETVRMHFLGA